MSKGQMFLNNIEWQKANTQIQTTPCSVRTGCGFS